MDLKKIRQHSKAILLVISILGSLGIHYFQNPKYQVEYIPIHIIQEDQNTLEYKKEEKKYLIKKGDVYPFQKEAKLTKLLKEKKENIIISKNTEYFSANLKKHYAILSLWPAFLAILFCWLTGQALPALFLASFNGAIALGYFDFINEVIIPSFSSKNSNLVIILYLWLLGGLLGIWSRTGAASAFANWVSRHFVKGPHSAKFVAWLLGIVFFQGGTLSTVLVGTTVKPLADKNKVSHEELSYIVDSTASPIACLIALNAWPAYIQAFLYVPGVAFLATESQRLSFFFSSLPLSFYSIFAVLGTFLFCFDKFPFLGKRMKEAQKRVRETGHLDSPRATPLSSKEIQETKPPSYYQPHLIEFILPLGVLLVIAIGTFVFQGKPAINIAFAMALGSALILTLLRGMKLNDLLEGLTQGYKGVIMGALILLFAILTGTISREMGAGLYLVELLGEKTPYYVLPALLLFITVLISFSTGTSWGTYAIVFPLAMPLAWSIGSHLAYPEFYLSICFAVVLNGSVIGDQSSPISDTTVLSSMCTGCDLMDHVRTQIVPVAWATLLASIGWTSLSFFA